MKIPVVMAVGLLLVACERAQVRDPEPKTVLVATATAGDALVTDDSIGPVIIGVAPGALPPRVKLIRDTTEGGMEDIPEQIAVLLVAGDTVRAAIDSGRIYRLTVTSPRFRTVDSVGAGTPLSRLLSDPTVYAKTGEGAVFVWSARRCGIGFRLWDPTKEAAERWDPNGLGDMPDSVGITRLRELPPSTTVGEVIVIGCSKDEPTSVAAQTQAPVGAASSTAASNAAFDSTGRLHFSSVQDSICGEVAENGLNIADSDRRAVATKFGRPDSVRTNPIPNIHRPEQTDTVVDVFYPGLQLHYFAINAKPPYDILQEAQVSNNKYLKFPQYGIGATASDITKAFGEPHERIGDTFKYSCALHIMSGADVTYHFAGGRVTRVDYFWESD